MENPWLYLFRLVSFVFHSTIFLSIKWFYFICYVMYCICYIVKKWQSTVWLYGFGFFVLFCFLVFLFGFAYIILYDAFSIYFLFHSVCTMILSYMFFFWLLKRNFIATISLFYCLVKKKRILKRSNIKKENKRNSKRNE